jgi:hypothetical protein
MYVARVRSGVYGKSGISGIRLALVGNETNTNSIGGLDKLGQIAPVLRSKLIIDQMRVELSQCQIGRAKQRE